MNKVNTNISLDPSIKQKSTAIFSKLGLDFSTAISLYLNQVIRHKGIPFDILIEDEPNKKTIESFKEEIEMSTNRKKYKRYKKFSELRAEIEKELSNE